MNDQEKVVVSELTTNLKTRCVGRYLVDLPGMVVARGSTRFQEVSIETTRMPQDAYEKALSELIKLRRNNNSDTSADQHLYDSGDAPSVSGSYFFVNSSSGASGSIRSLDSSRAIEAYKWDRGYQIVLRIDAYDARNLDYTSDSVYGPILKRLNEDRPPTDVPQKTRLVLDILKRVQGRADDSIPTEPGLCFVGGFLPGKAGPGEQIEDSFAVQGKPDVMFTFRMYTDGHDPVSESMPNRLSKVREYVESAGGRVIRSGSVRLGDMKAGEMLLEGPFAPPVKGHNFLLEANTTTGGPETPYLTFEMDNGNNSFLFPDGERVKQASLTDNEAIAVWDVISRTMRPRPNGF
ncbi:T6SS immunity protein Tli4 family protein [Burkholderia anthina]|uniref:T6SS immunity protein Tli4 family protein n=1 Tax=Burkholderia anthina TaxID=179879 RepID=UPI00158F651A|nr:T6SS immunity protein Tli4 family protein [Burkholderia anthina]